MDVLAWLQPWEFSPALVLACAASAWLFLRGRRVHHVGAVRQSLFWIGWVMLYLSMHTQLDYYAERMFFIHRLQHLVLHHLGPLLVMGAYPGQVMRAGLPLAWRVRLAAARRAGAETAAFATVVRPRNDPACPADYRPPDDFWRKRGYEPVKGLVTELSWKEHGEAEESPKRLQYWMRRL